MSQDLYGIKVEIINVRASIDNVSDSVDSLTSAIKDTNELLGAGFLKIAELLQQLVETQKNISNIMRH